MSRRLALVIGNSDYIDTGLADLSAPTSDVDGLATLLRDPEIGDFDEVISLVNEKLSAIQRTIVRFLAQRVPDDLLLLYFSGHGVLNEEGHLYLAVNETERDLLSVTSIPAKFLAEEMDRSRSRRQVLILDCCYGGAFARGTKAETQSKAITQSTFEGEGFGRVVLTASDATQYAWEGNEIIGQTQNSLFTHYLIQGLKTGIADKNDDGFVGLGELYEYVYEQVVNNKRVQTPSKWSYRQQGDIIIARNPRPVVNADLPPELQQTIESQLPSFRETAVRELGQLLVGRNRGLALTAKEMLAQIAENDDSRRVSKAAIDVLTAYENGSLEGEGEKPKSESDAGILTTGQLQAEQALTNNLTAIFDHLIKNDPNNFSAYLDRANIYLNSGRYNEALTDFSQAIKINPNSPNAYFSRGIVYHSLGRHIDAIEDFTRVIELNPPVFINQAYANRAAAHFVLQNYDEALSDYSQSIQVSPNTTETYLKRGSALFFLKRYDEAAADYNEAIKLNPNYALAYSFRGQLYFQKGNLHEALSDFTHSIQLDHQNSQTFLNRGVVYTHLLRYDEAMKDYSQAIQLNPSDFQAYLNRGQIYLNQKKLDECLKDYSQAIQIMPTNAAGYVYRGLAYEVMQQFEEAVKDYTRAIQLDPNSAMAYSGRGSCFFNLQRHNEALADLSQAIFLNPNLAISYLNRGTLYTQYNRYAEALQDFNRVIQLTPDSAQAYFKAGIALLFLGQKEQCIQYLDKAAQLGDPLAKTTVEQLRNPPNKQPN